MHTFINTIHAPFYQCPTDAPRLPPTVAPGPVSVLQGGVCARHRTMSLPVQRTPTCRRQRGQCSHKVKAAEERTSLARDHAQDDAGEEGSEEEGPSQR